LSLFSAVFPTSVQASLSPLLIFPLKLHLSHFGKSAGLDSSSGFQLRGILWSKGAKLKWVENYCGTMLQAGRSSVRYLKKSSGI
jgi:hypothetical protein